MEPQDLIGKKIVYRTLRDKLTGTVMRTYGDECVKVKVWQDDELATVNVRDIIRVLG